MTSRAFPLPSSYFHISGNSLATYKGQGLSFVACCQVPPQHSSPSFSQVWLMKTNDCDDAINDQLTGDLSFYSVLRLCKYQWKQKFPRQLQALPVYVYIWLLSCVFKNVLVLLNVGCIYTLLLPIVWNEPKMERCISIRLSTCFINKTT
jgi:hypothetical protein